MFNENIGKLKNELFIKDLRKCRETVSDELVLKLWYAILENDLKTFKKLFKENSNLTLYIIDDEQSISKKCLDNTISLNCLSTSYKDNNGNQIYLLDLFMGLIKLNKHEMVKYAVNNSRLFKSPRCNYLTYFYYKLEFYLDFSIMNFDAKRYTELKEKTGKTVKFLIKEFNSYLTTFNAYHVSDLIQSKSVFHTIARYADDDILKYAIKYLDKKNIWELCATGPDMRENDTEEILYNAIIYNTFISTKSIEPLFDILTDDFNYGNVMNNQIGYLFYDLIKLTNQDLTKDFSESKNHPFTVQNYIDRFAELIRLVDKISKIFSDKSKKQNDIALKNLLSHAKRMNNQNIIKILEERELSLCK